MVPEATDKAAVANRHTPSQLGVPDFSGPMRELNALYAAFRATTSPGHAQYGNRCCPLFDMLGTTGGQGDSSLGCERPSQFCEPLASAGLSVNGTTPPAVLWSQHTEPADTAVRPGVCAPRRRSVDGARCGRDEPPRNPSRRPEISR